MHAGLSTLWIRGLAALLLVVATATGGVRAQPSVPSSAILVTSECPADGHWRWLEVEPARASQSGWIINSGVGTIRIVGTRFHADLQLDPDQAGANLELDGSVVNGRIRATELLLNTDAPPASVQGALRRQRVGDCVEERIALRGGQSGDASFLGLYRRLAIEHLFASPRLTPSSIRADVARDGAKSVVDRLWSSGRWDLVERQIASGQRAWIELAPLLAHGTDAATSEGLGISLAFALPKNPKAVLAVLDLEGGAVIGPNTVCGIPFTEAKGSLLRRYATTAPEVVARVGLPELSKARRACLRELNLRIAALREARLLTSR